MSSKCRNLTKKPWPNNHKVLGFRYGALINNPRFLNQVPKLSSVHIQSLNP